MTAVLLLSCPDQRGVVAATAQFIASHVGNIVHAEEHVDVGAGDGNAVFFQRGVLTLPADPPRWSGSWS